MMNELPFYVWLILAIVLLLQGLWIFWDASKRGENKWLWGLFGLMNTPGNLIIYLVVTRFVLKQNPCPSCKKNIRTKYIYCPHCGESVK